MIITVTNLGWSDNLDEVVCWKKWSLIKIYDNCYDFFLLKSLTPIKLYLNVFESVYIYVNIRTSLKGISLSSIAANIELTITSDK